MEHLATVPADAPLPKDIYGYQVLLKVFGSEPAARVVAKASADYHRKDALKSGLDPQPLPKPPDGPPPPDNLWYQHETDPPPSTPRPDAAKPDAPKPAIEVSRIPIVPRMPSRVDSDNPPDWSEYPPRSTMTGSPPP